MYLRKNFSAIRLSHYFISIFFCNAFAQVEQKYYLFPYFFYCLWRWKENIFLFEKSSLTGFIISMTSFTDFSLSLSLLQLERLERSEMIFQRTRRTCDIKPILNLIYRNDFDRRYYLLKKLFKAQFFK